MFRTWLCLCLGNLFNGNVTSQTEGLASGVHLRLFSRLQDDSPEVRAAACFAIACLLRPPPVPRHIQCSLPYHWCPLSDYFQRCSSVFDVFSGNRLYPQQPMIPPQTPTAERIPWSPSTQFCSSGKRCPGMASTTAPASVLRNPSQDPGQTLRAQSCQYEQKIPTSPLTGPDMIRESSAQGRSQTNSQSNVSRQQIQQPHGEPSNTNQFSMFEDRRRLALDLLIAKTTLATLDDANPMVRCEAVFVISTILGKYLPAFLSASEEMTLTESNTRGGNDCSDTAQFPFPSNIDNEAAESFRQIWSSLNTTRQVDAHPVVRRAANAIVRFVHERLIKGR
ncbi:Raptor N-terminal CASPase like domain [Fragilaria crotonensis]|nr:Raptor N-terminal CASPase like domain [Fragilaria crotonensis]